MAMISVRVSSDLPIQSNYLPLISLYFSFGILYTFISFNWFIIANVYRTNNYLPKYLKMFAKCLKYFNQKMLKKLANKIEVNQENKTKSSQENNMETDGLINLLNYFAFSLFLAMFVSYFTIWIIIST